MNKQDITAKVIEILDERGFPEANENNNLKVDLGMDSLDRVEIEIDIEKEFDVRVPNFKSDEWVVVSDIVNDIIDLRPKKFDDERSNGTAN